MTGEGDRELRLLSRGEGATPVYSPNERRIVMSREGRNRRYNIAIMRREAPISKWSWAVVVGSSSRPTGRRLRSKYDLHRLARPEQLVTLCRIVQRQPVRDDLRGVDVSLGDCE